MLYRTCLLLAALVTFIAATAQRNSYVLRGRIKGLHSGKVKLLFGTNLYELDLNDSAKVRNGAFEIKGRLPQPYPYATYLWLNDSVRTGMFFVGNGIQEINIDLHHFQAAPTADSGINAENMAYLQSMIPNDNTVSDLFETAKDISLKNYILTYPSSYVSLWYLYCRVSMQGYRPELRSAFDNLKENLRNNPLGRQIHTLLDNTRKITVGATFPRLPLESLSGKTGRFAPNKNKKIILIDFWSSHCKPALAQFNGLKEIYSRFSAAGFDIIGISTDKDSERKSWRTAITQYKLPWAQFLDVNQSEAQKMAIDCFPYNFILDSNGKILYKNVSLIQLRRILEEYCR